MSSIFRLRYYLRRPGEKRPLLLLEPVIGTFTQEFPEWLLYKENGACDEVELRTLQAISKPQTLLRELRSLSGKSAGELLGELGNLWQSSVKGVAVRHLEPGQLLASEGAGLACERGYYALLSGLPADLQRGSGGVAVRLTERGRNSDHPANSSNFNVAGLLTAIESFPAGDGLIWLCRLVLESRQWISSKQALSPEFSLYQVSCMHRSAPPESPPQPLPAPLSDTPDCSEANANGARDIFLFAPISSVTHVQHLKNFLKKHEPFHFQLEDLEDLAADFFGWGEYRGSQEEEWSILGAWRIRSEYLQKYGSYMYKRACRFGGYPVAALTAELSGQLPLALIKSLCRYLYTGSAKEPLNGPNGLRDSCRKVAGYLLAKETMYAENTEPKYISPQGRKMWDELLLAGENGLPYSSSEVSEALLRSGWAKQNGPRCYAAAVIAPAPPAAEEEDLRGILNSYKKKHSLQAAGDSLGQKKHHKSHASPRQNSGGRANPFSPKSGRNISADNERGSSSAPKGKKGKLNQFRAKPAGKPGKGEPAKRRGEPSQFRFRQKG